MSAIDTVKKILDTRNRESQTWAEHRDINSVMLATCLMPDGYLEL